MARQRKRKTQPRSNVTFRLFRRHFDQFFLKVLFQGCLCNGVCVRWQLCSIGGAPLGPLDW